MSLADKRIDEHYVETLLFSRDRIRVSEELKENTLFTLSKLQEQQLMEESAQRKVFKNIMAVFSILIFLFGVLIAQNIHFFETLYLVVKSFSGGLSMAKFLQYGKYVILSLAAVPAITFFIIETRKRHTDRHMG